MSVYIKDSNMLNYVETPLSAPRLTRVHVQETEEEFDRDLFEPPHDIWNTDDDVMDAGQTGLHTENLLYDDDGIFQRRAQGKLSTNVEIYILNILTIY
jgi:hypothetical protein